MVNSKQTAIRWSLPLHVVITAALAMLLALRPCTAQESAGQLIEASQGLTVTGVMMDARGRIFVGPVEIAGQSPDDLFTYWIGRHGEKDFYGYDAFSGTWMPGPVTYHKAMLDFQGEKVEGWIRKFAGMPDYRRVFGLNGRLYERYQNIYAGEKVYTYFVDMASGERSDAHDLLGFLSGNRGWMDVVLEQQRLQAEEIIRRSEELGRDYAFWQRSAHVPPAAIRSFSDTLQQIVMPESIVDQTEPSLLELIEEEIGAMLNQQDEPVPAGEPES